MTTELSRRSLIAGLAALAALGAGEPASASGVRIVSQLPSSMAGKVAWTVDDGYSNTALADYLKVALNHDMKFTFFVNTVYQAWYRHKSTIKELLAQEQIQLANHTHSHRDLTSLSEKKVKQELLGCHERILDNFGYDARPYFRPPYGSSNAKVRSIAAELGYTTEVLWFGSLADAGTTNARAVARNAEKWFKSQRIVIAHANSPVAIENFDEINAVIQARGLETVTIRDAFG